MELAFVQDIAIQPHAESDPSTRFNNNNNFISKTESVWLCELSDTDSSSDASNDSSDDTVLVDSETELDPDAASGEIIAMGLKYDSENDMDESCTSSTRRDPFLNSYENVWQDYGAIAQSINGSPTLLGHTKTQLKKRLSDISDNLEHMRRYESDLDDSRSKVNEGVMSKVIHGAMFVAMLAIVFCMFLCT